MRALVMSEVPREVANRDHEPREAEDEEGKVGEADGRLEEVVLRHVRPPLF